MNKIICIAASAALVLSSCDKNPLPALTDTDGNAISFSVYASRTATKATNVINLDTLKKRGFGVFAFYTGQKTYAQSGLTQPNFMKNQLVKYGQSGWEYSPLKFWPNTTGDKLSFFAYAPYDENKVWNATGTTTHFKVDSLAGKQIDLLFATGLTDKTKQAYKDSIKFQFKHALSKIGFNVAYMIDTTVYNKEKNIDLDANTKIVIDSVILKPVKNGFYKEADLNMTATEIASAWNVGTSPTYYRSFKLNAKDNFNNPSAATTDHPYGQVVTKELAQLNNDNSYLMVIPQDFSSSTDSLDIIVNYHVWTKDASLSETPADQYAKIVNNLSSNHKIKFEGGTQYTINLILGLTSIKISADIVDWNSSTTTVY